MELHNREQLETEMRRRARLLSAAHRRELARLLGNPPDIANVPDSFWRQLRDNTEAMLIGMLVTVFVRSARQHGANLPAAAQAANSFAANNAIRRARQYVAKLLDRLRAISRKWLDRLGLGGRMTRREMTSN